MTKQALAEEIRRKRGERGVSSASEAVDAVFDALDSLARADEKVTIRGFGNFEMRDRKARKGRNPRTGESIDIAPRRVLVFTDRRA